MVLGDQEGTAVFVNDGTIDIVGSVVGVEVDAVVGMMEEGTAVGAFDVGPPVGGTEDGESEAVIAEEGPNVGLFEAGAPVEGIAESGNDGEGVGINDGKADPEGCKLDGVDEDGDHDGAAVVVSEGIIDTVGADEGVNVGSVVGKSEMGVRVGAADEGPSVEGTKVVVIEVGPIVDGETVIVKGIAEGDAEEVDGTTDS